MSKHNFSLLYCTVVFILSSIITFGLPVGSVRSEIVGPKPVGIDRNNELLNPSRENVVASPQAAISLTSLGTAVTENFDTLPTSGTSSALPNGWAFAESGTNANTTFNAGTGSSSTGDTYNFGVAGTNPITDRALGGLRSSSLIPTIGASFVNNTGATITSIDISYNGEQWRLGAFSRGSDRIDFQYSTDATSLTGGSWTDVNSLDFSSPNTTTGSTLDGNSSINRANVSSTVSGLNIPNGATVWIRWTDFDVSGSDDGLAVDDFSLAPHGTAASQPEATNMSASETYTEDTPLNLTDIVVTDADSTSVTATLAISVPAAGSLSTATSGSTTSTYNAGTGLWTASGPITEVNGLLADVVFTPTLNFNSNFTIATSVTDGVTSPVTGSKAMTGVPVNDAPTATNLSAAETYTEDTSLNLVDIIVTDVDSANVTATLTLSDPSAGSLSTGTSGPVTSTFNPATGLWTASGSIANVNTLLAGVVFTPALNVNGAFTIATSVSDDLLAVAGSKTMSGTAVNDAPTATNLSASETYDEDAELNLIDIVASDVDSSTVTATLTLSNTAAGNLTVSTSGAVTSTFNSGTGTWTATGPTADVNALLASVKYAPSANFNSNFLITTSVSDGIASPITGSKTVVGVPVNDAPVLDAAKSPTLASIQQDAGAPAGAVGTLVSNLVDFAFPVGQVDNVTDPDSGALLGIAVTNADTTNGLWFYSIDGGASWNPLGSVSDSGARLLAGDVSTRLYFQPNAGFFGQASITFSAWDQTAGINGSLQSTTPNGGSTTFSSASDTAVITVAPTPPTLQFSSATYSGPEGFATTITVTRTGDISGTSSVDWSTSGIGGGTCDTVGVDYETASGTLLFDADEASKTFSVQLCTDHESDNGESVSLDLENVQGATLGTTASATLQILDAAAQFTNMQSLAIGTGSTSSPYGTSIEVSGWTSLSGVKLTLFGVNYANPDDLDVLLVGPSGETFVPIADVGGSSPLENATVTLEDAALVQLPDNDAISDGQNYRPAVCTFSGTVADFPAPAPGGSYNQAGCTSTSSTFASVFGNTPPNGTWTLYVRDDNGDPVRSGAAGGSIAGWGIQLLAPTSAEVTVSGRVRTPEGMGIRGALVTITGGYLGQPVMAMTNSFGYYRLENVPAGASYVVTVQARRYGFAQPSRMLNVQDNIADIDFVSAR